MTGEANYHGEAALMSAAHQGIGREITRQFAAPGGGIRVAVLGATWTDAATRPDHVTPSRQSQPRKAPA